MSRLRLRVGVSEKGGWASGDISRNELTLWAYKVSTSFSTRTRILDGSERNKLTLMEKPEGEHAKPRVVSNMHNRSGAAVGGRVFVDALAWGSAALTPETD